MNEGCCDNHKFVYIWTVLMAKSCMNKDCCDSHEFVCVEAILMA